jgi:hypothetical protein
MRRWMEGVRIPPATVIDQVEALVRTLDQAAESAIRAIDEAGAAPAALLVYRHDRDVPPWSGLRTAGCHLALGRRVVDRRPDVPLVTYSPGAYRRWLGSGLDSEESRGAWAATRVGRKPPAGASDDAGSCELSIG